MPSEVPLLGMHNIYCISQSDTDNIKYIWLNSQMFMGPNIFLVGLLKHK